MLQDLKKLIPEGTTPTAAQKQEVRDILKGVLQEKGGLEELQEWVEYEETTNGIPQPDIVAIKKNCTLCLCGVVKLQNLDKPSEWMRLIAEADEAYVGPHGVPGRAWEKIEAVHKQIFDSKGERRRSRSGRLRECGRV